MQIQQYLKDTYQDTHQSRVVADSSDDKGDFIIIEDTIFYPQGGGQPFDIGTIQAGDSLVNVTGIFFDPAIVGDYQIKHYIPSDQKDGVKVGDKVTMKINLKNRLINAKNHTAGHLLGFSVEGLTGQSSEHLPKGKPIRIMAVEDLEVMGCGGTHIQNTSEISEFKIRKIAIKKGVTKISYIAC